MNIAPEHSTDGNSNLNNEKIISLRTSKVDYTKRTFKRGNYECGQCERTLN